MYLRRMRSKYIIYFILVGIVSLFCIYFQTAFCGVYINSQTGWLQGGIISFILQAFGIELLIPLIIGANRYIAIKLESR